MEIWWVIVPGRKPHSLTQTLVSAEVWHKAQVRSRVVPLHISVLFLTFYFIVLFCVTSGSAQVLLLTPGGLGGITWLLKIKPELTTCKAHAQPIVLSLLQTPSLISEYEILEWSLFVWLLLFHRICLFFEYLLSWSRSFVKMWVYPEFRQTSKICLL